MSKVHKGQVALLSKIDLSIAALKASEKVTKAELSVVSRDLLEYLVLNSSTDIGAANRLLDVLTPMNRATAVLFFNHFLPWKYDEETKHFTSMVVGEKKLDKYSEKVKTFMADASNNIWTWAEANVDIAPKPKNYAGLITALVTKAMADEQKNDSVSLSASEVLKAVMVGGVSAAEVMELVDQLTDVPDETPGAEVIALHGGDADAPSDTTTH